ncbi:MAG: hypothetical protein HGA35_01490 [Erysipelotrichaceae bacterium]|nr:hypothetical protein [Erysipelotrichaceae bacterium]
MLTNADIKTIISDNLADIRIFSIQAFLTRLIKREKFGDGILQYRIKDKVTNSFVTDLNDFIAKLDTNSLVPDYFYYSDKMQGDRTHPFAVNISNFTVSLDANSDEDSVYFGMFGRDDKNILLLLNYLSDGDLVLPLKIYEIRLIGQK